MTPAVAGIMYLNHHHNMSKATVSLHMLYIYYRSIYINVNVVTLTVCLASVKCYFSSLNVDLEPQIRIYIYSHKIDVLIHKCVL